MLHRLRSLLARHPLVSDAARWAVPAVIFGGLLRVLFLSYSPFAYWGSDSSSYYSFTHQLLTSGDISLDEKRRYLYPLLLLPVSLLPGAPLQWLALLQHALGLVTLLPLAYVVRKTCVHWRWWIVPVTAAYGSLPCVLWYEHELLGETLFFAALVWMLAGWCAWVGAAHPERARRLFWWFLVPLAVFLLTKPAGRFVWPGVLLGLVMVAAWRTLDGRRWLALGALLLLSLTVGSKKQGAWLLYVATFPLTRLETPRHAEYKAEIRDLVEPLRRDLPTYYVQDDEPFDFLENPGRQSDRPLWQALDRDARRKAALYLDLATEGIQARPDLFLYLGWQRIVASAALSEFKEGRFAADYAPKRVEHHYEEARELLARGKTSPIPRVFGLDSRQPLPPYPELAHRLSPRPDSWGARLVPAWTRGYERLGEVVRLPDAKDRRERVLSRAKITPVGVWLLAGIVLSLLPAYRRTLGVGALIALSYLGGVFLVSQANPRYFAPAWALLVPLLAVPADTLLRTLRKSPRA